MAVEPAGDAFAICLDGRRILSPGKVPLAVPTKALADLIAAEWAGQGEAVDMASMRLTRLAYSAMDCQAEDRARHVASICEYGRSDLLCYRAEAPEGLAVRQKAEWQPWLDWAAATHEVRLEPTAGIMAIEQPAHSIERLKELASVMPTFALVAFQPLTAVLGSVVLALAVKDDALAASEAHRLANLDALYQEEQWGVDAEAAERRRLIEDEVLALRQFLVLL